jgi:protease-4
MAALMKSVGAAAQAMPLAAYFDEVGLPHDSGPTIALIYADGLIQRGKSTDNPLGGAGVLGADTVIDAFRAAQHDPSVRAILFRIDSPGGSAVASESIWRAVVRARQAGKPVVVSMGNVAGSGGYYIAAAADRIVAEPGTLTGSIGVVAGKLLIDGLMQKAGASWDAVQIGDDAAIFSPLQEFSPQGYQRFEAFLDAVYAGFKARVAEGRKLTPDQVEDIAKGRVWTGEQAKARGLVDALGGYSLALTLTKQAAHIPGDQNVTVKLFPPPRSNVTTVLARLVGGAVETDGPATLALSRLTTVIHPLLERLALAARSTDALVMPAIEVR